MNSKTSYESDTITLQEVIDKEIFFKIPLYQRLYVWEKEQIHALLSDIVTSFRKKPDKSLKERPIFYLGNVILQKDGTNEEIARYELIDGQQRFTTLWLLSIYLQRSLEEYALPSRISQNDTKEAPLRIEFAIRDQVNEFMHEIINQYDDQSVERLDLESLVRKNPEKGLDTGTLDPLANAFNEIHAFFTNIDREVNKQALSEYIRTRVQLIKTVVPDGTDLNKLFEVLNNRGVQLEHHQILKARMLEVLNNGNGVLDNRPEHFSTLWDSCSDMNEYIEKGFQDATGKRIPALHSYGKENNKYSTYKNSALVLSDLKELDREKENSRAGDESQSFLNDGIPLSDLFDDNFPGGDRNGHGSTVDDERSQEIKSIINFPMLLQHTLRIYLKEKDRPDIDRILDKELLETFETHFFEYLEELENDDQRALEVANFISLLWEVRFVFDQYVVKWQKDRGTDILKLCKVYHKKDSNSLYREGNNYKAELCQLQRLLYHSQEMRTFYWLTPYLHFLHKFYNILRDRRELELTYLKYLDNHLLNIDQSIELQPLIERTSEFLDEIKNQDVAGRIKYNPSTKPVSEPAEGRDGVHFPHYWFYKLEFILWLSLRNEHATDHKGLNKYYDDIKYFKITAKNSVEHIAPQTPKDSEEEFTEKVLNSFGNLGLVSRSLNSSFSNSRYDFKRQKFIESYKDHKRIESLKLLLVYESGNKEWQKQQIISHQDNMINYFDDYIKICQRECEALRTL